MDVSRRERDARVGEGLVIATTDRGVWIVVNGVSCGQVDTQ